MIIELSKTYVKQYYNNDFTAALKARDGVYITDKAVHDIKNYINNNKLYCRYYDTKTGKRL